MDLYRCIVDTGCPKTVTGRMWMDAFAESKEKNVKIKVGKENESFRFGPSDIYNSKENYEIKVEIGEFKRKD